MLHEVAITMIPNIGASLAKNLIAYCGSAEAVFKAPKAKLLKIPLIGNERAQSIIDAKEVLKKAEVELKFMSDYKIQPLFFTDALFPQRLKDCNDAPILLYYKGNTFIVKWTNRSFDADAYVMFQTDDEGKPASIKMKPISPLTDFSFDFQDLDLRRVEK